MITQLADYLGAEKAHLIRTYLWWTVLASILQALALGASIPVLRALIAGDLTAAGQWLIVLVVIAVVYWVLDYRGVRQGFAVAIELLTGLRYRIGDHIATLPLGWFTPARTGRLGQVLSMGVMDMLALPAHQLTPLIRAVVTPATLLAVLASVDWRLGTIAAVCIVPMALVYWVTGKAGKRSDAAVTTSMAATSDRILEFAHTQPVLRTLDRSGAGRSLIDRALTEQNRRERRQLWLTVPALLAGNVIMQLALLAIVAGLLVLTAEATDIAAVLTLVAALPVANRLIAPLGEIAGYAVAIRQSRAVMGDIEEILATEPLPEPAHPRTPEGASITARSLSFSYDGRHPVIEDVGFVVPERSLTAIVGPSGSGKSTLIRLLSRFADPTSGTVSIGGVALTEMDAESLYSMTAPVFQDSYLFSGTIEDNVRLARPDATEAQLDQAAQLARLTEVLAALPDGWATPVGEGGARLSGGQRQRVALARALLKGTPILLLDEATGSLDAENQQAVSATITELAHQRTVVVIAHQLTTITAADQILFLEGGHIIERGTHAKLLAEHGRYARHWELLSAAKQWRASPAGDRHG